MISDAIDKMVDHSCDEETERKIYEAVMEHEEVLGIDLLQTRIFGNKIYTPVDFVMLQKAKMLVAVRMVGLPIFLSQFVSCAVRIIDPAQGSLLELNVWIPLLTGGIFLISKYVEYRRLCVHCLFSA